MVHSYQYRGVLRAHHTGKADLELDITSDSSLEGLKCPGFPVDGVGLWGKESAVNGSEPVHFAGLSRDGGRWLLHTGR